MRIRILSDLHLEVGPWAWQPMGEDLVILAGDVADQSRIGLDRRQRLWEELARAGLPTLYVLGNHEGYADWVPRDELRRRIEAELPANVRILDRDSYDFGGVRFLGCTLWSDFSLLETVAPHAAVTSTEQAMRYAEVGITDFKYLCLPCRTPPVRISPSDMAAWHRDDRSWLTRAIEGANRPTVVITHFLPSPASIDQKYAGSPLNPYFATDCRPLMKKPVRLWIHGHTHHSCDYLHNRVHIVCNPRGYVGDDVNPNFRDHLVVNISPSD